MSEMSLDEIMSGRGESMPETPTAPKADADTPAPVDGASRDEKGRFAAKADPTPDAPAPAPAEPQAPTPENPEQQPSGFVPIKALDAERGKRKELEDRYEKDMRELREQISRLSQPQQPAEPPKPPPTLWDAPDDYFASRISPIEERINTINERYSERLAIQEYGADTVNAAKAAIEQIAATPQGQQIVRALAASDDPFDMLVKWHRQHSFQTEIGSDPEAYKQKIIAEYLASQQQPAQPQSPTPPAPAPVMPSSFAKSPTSGPRGPEVASGPRALSDIMKR